MMVFQGDRHVGHMTWNHSRGMSHAIFRQMSPMQPAYYNPKTDPFDPRLSEFKETVVPIGSRRMEINSLEIATADFLTSSKPEDRCVELARLKLGKNWDLSDCEISRRYDMDSFILEWRVLQVTPEQHEELFDMDQFEPV